MINYSFIIPHKNTPKLLERCINSIPNRKDIQIIIVDDNSEEGNNKFDFILNNSEKSIEIYLTEENRGAGYARNFGIAKAKGTWLIFSDSDDTFVTDNLDKAMTEFLSSTNDVIYFDANCLEEGTFKALPNLNRQYKKYLYSNISRDDKCRYNIRVPWGKFIKRELVEKYTIRCDETKVCNDLLFSTKVGYYAKEISIYHYPIYNWMVQKNSLTSSKSKDSVMTHFMGGVRRNLFLEEKKIFKYRKSLFINIPSLHKNAGYSYWGALKLILKYIPLRFILRDIFKFIEFTLNRI